MMKFYYNATADGTCELHVNTGAYPDPQALPRFSRPGGGFLPRGARLTSLNLLHCALGAAEVQQCPQLAALERLEVRACSCPGGVDVPLDALLQLCGPQLTELRFSPAHAIGWDSGNSHLTAFPPQLTACPKLQQLLLIQKQASWEWPAGPYLTGALLLVAFGRLLGWNCVEWTVDPRR